MNAFTILVAYIFRLKSICLVVRNMKQISYLDLNTFLDNNEINGIFMVQSQKKKITFQHVFAQSSGWIWEKL